MGLTKMPNELQCLAQRLLADAAHLVAVVGRLPPAARAEAMPDARAMQFDAGRLLLLADDQADALRAMFTRTMHMVDDLRASAAIEGGWSDSLTNAVGHAGDLQQMICAEFPGEEFPGAD